MTPDEIETACLARYIKRRLLWTSNRDNPNDEYYADKLYLVQVDDGLWTLELKVGGTVSCFPIQNIDKYV